ncbi:hypothetical protein BASU183_20625 [Bacillus subtilis]|nr:hypothetical protein S100333_01374 [Bacillus subtilis subsp. subtilis]PLV38051.1 hypothetical protein BSP2_21190 [Bacillus subtilis subsp. subtilis]POD83401.1 hypothetical protein S101384_04079 [Bacillus subtilis subsp. subtilis]
MALYVFEVLGNPDKCKIILIFNEKIDIGFSAAIYQGEELFTKLQGYLKAPLCRCSGPTRG